MPIVIHNAIDVAPKGEFVFRSATVDVEVLPPIDTSDWQVKTIDKHVAEVRNLFLQVLKQEQKSAPAEDQPQIQVEPEIDTDGDDSSTEKWDNVVLGRWD